MGDGDNDVGVEDIVADGDVGAEEHAGFAGEARGAVGRAEGAHEVSDDERKEVICGDSAALRVVEGNVGGIANAVAVFIGPGSVVKDEDVGAGGMRVWTDVVERAGRRVG